MDYVIHSQAEDEQDSSILFSFCNDVNSKLRGHDKKTMLFKGECSRPVLDLTINKFKTKVNLEVLFPPIYLYILLGAGLTALMGLFKIR